jgi:hypothetical protein
MNMDQLEERMRNAISAGAIQPSATTWPGVVARRALRQTTRSRRVRWLVAAGLVGAAASVVVITRDRPTSGRPASGFDARSQAVEASMFGPEALLAQTVRPAFAPISPDDPIGLRLRGGSWTYGVSRGGNAAGEYTYSARRTELNGQRAWLLVHGTGRATRYFRGADSLWTTADSMRPLQRVSLLPSGRREQTFRADDVLIGTTQNGYTTWRTVPLRDSTRKQVGAVIRSNEIAIMLQAMPLGPAWKGSIPLAGSGEAGMFTPVWFNFQVEGSEVVTVPAGTFDCWRVRMGMTSEVDSLIKGERPGMTMWISKDRQWLVQQTIVIPGKDSWKHALVAGAEE